MKKRVVGRDTTVDRVLHPVLVDREDGHEATVQNTEVDRGSSLVATPAYLGTAARRVAHLVMPCGKGLYVDF
jgi:hypothetical protein